LRGGTWNPADGDIPFSESSETSSENNCPTDLNTAEKLDVAERLVCPNSGVLGPWARLIRMAYHQPSDECRNFGPKPTNCETHFPANRGGKRRVESF